MLKNDWIAGLVVISSKSSSSSVSRKKIHCGYTAQNGSHFPVNFSLVSARLTGSLCHVIKKTGSSPEIVKQVRPKTGRNVNLYIFILSFRTCILSYRELSYPIVRVSYQVIRLSYCGNRLSGFAFIRFSVYLLSGLSGFAYIV